MERETCCERPALYGTAAGTRCFTCGAIVTNAAQEMSLRRAEERERASKIARVIGKVDSLAWQNLLSRLGVVFAAHGTEFGQRLNVGRW